MYQRYKILPTEKRTDKMRDTIKKSIRESSMLGFMLACGEIQKAFDENPKLTINECINIACAKYDQYIKDQENKQS